MRDHETEFAARNAKVAVVTFEADFVARSYVKETSLAWPLLVDADREAYRKYGMLSASFWDIWGPATWRAYRNAIRNGGKLKRGTGDICQRGGDVLIDPEGKVVLHHVGAGPADRPPVEVILRKIAPPGRCGYSGPSGG